jgi:hypothetical protein
MLHPQINAHKESLPFLMSKKWEAVQSRAGFSFGNRTNGLKFVAQVIGLR